MNVFGIAELAGRYQMLSLLSKCERSLLTCVEIPLIDRFLFADLFNLKGTKVSEFVNKSFLYFTTNY